MAFRIPNFSFMLNIALWLLFTNARVTSAAEYSNLLSRLFEQASHQGRPLVVIPKNQRDHSFDHKRDHSSDHQNHFHSDSYERDDSAVWDSDIPYPFLYLYKLAQQVNRNQLRKHHVKSHDYSNHGKHDYTRSRHDNELDHGQFHHDHEPYVKQKHDNLGSDDSLRNTKNKLKNYKYMYYKYTDYNKGKNGGNYGNNRQRVIKNRHRGHYDNDNRDSSSISKNRNSNKNRYTYKAKNNRYTKRPSNFDHNHRVTKRYNPRLSTGKHQEHPTTQFEPHKNYDNFDDSPGSITDDVINPNYFYDNIDIMNLPRNKLNGDDIEHPRYNCWHHDDKNHHRYSNYNNHGRSHDNHERYHDHDGYLDHHNYLNRYDDVYGEDEETMKIKDIINSPLFKTLLKISDDSVLRQRNPCDSSTNSCEEVTEKNETYDDPCEGNSNSCEMETSTNISTRGERT